MKVLRFKISQTTLLHTKADYEVIFGTAWKVAESRVFPGPYFFIFSPNLEFLLVCIFPYSVQIQIFFWSVVFQIQSKSRVIYGPCSPILIPNAGKCIFHAVWHYQEIFFMEPLVEELINVSIKVKMVFFL